MNKNIFKNQKKKSTPLITIITSTYNAENLLPKTIDSIKKIKKINFEWIVIDGGSRDGTVNLIKNNSNMISNWISEPDHGIYDAWNKGIYLSQGEWISFIGAGDCYIDDALNNYLNSIKSFNSCINFVSSKVKFIDQNGNVKKIWGEILNKKRFKQFMSVAHVGALHHKSLFKKNQNFDIKFKTAADYEFLLSNLDKIKPAFLNQVTAEMIIGGSSDTYYSLWEKYKIQKKYLNSIQPLYYFLESCFKRIMRKIIKGY